MYNVHTTLTRSCSESLDLWPKNKKFPRKDEGHKTRGDGKDN